MLKYLLIVLLAMTLVVSGCQQQTNTSNNQDNNSNNQVNENNNLNTGTTANQVVINMKARKFEFEPSIIKVKQGDKVKLIITSEDVAHGFAISDYNINKKLESGKTETIEFTADKKGEFTFFCSVLCGSGHSDMQGKLIVE